MFELRGMLPASPIVIRGWLSGFAERILPLYPDPQGWGQPQMSTDPFITDVTLRPLAVPPEIEAAGGFGVGLEMAFGVGNGDVQPMGPVVVFVVVPMGADRSELRVFFPLGLAYESRHRVPEELKRSWPGIEILPDHMPLWVYRDFDRRALFEAIATRGWLPPGAPPRRPLHPLPWRDLPSDTYQVEHSQAHDRMLTPSVPDSESVVEMPPRPAEPDVAGTEAFSDESVRDAAPEQNYEAPHKGRFKRRLQFLHEVGWLLAQLAHTTEPESLESVSDWSDRYSEVQSASRRQLKTATRRWYDGSWPRAREAAANHYASCNEGPSCVPRNVPPDVRK
jgi:hypothetical protein